MTLSFDLVANDWLRARFPAIRAELGDGADAAAAATRVARQGRRSRARSFHPLRTRARHWDAGDGAGRRERRPASGGWRPSGAWRATPARSGRARWRSIASCRSACSGSGGRRVAPAPAGRANRADSCVVGHAEEHVEITVARIMYADLQGIDSHGCCMLPFYQQLRPPGRAEPEPDDRGRPRERSRPRSSTAAADSGTSRPHWRWSCAIANARRRRRRRRRGAQLGPLWRCRRVCGDGGRARADRTRDDVARRRRPSCRRSGARHARHQPDLVRGAGRAQPPFLLDMATSTVSLGKLLERWRRGRASRAAGRSTRRGARTNGTDGRAAPAADAARRRRQRAAATKATGSPRRGDPVGVLPGVARRRPERRRATVGHFFLALDPARFRADGGSAGSDALIDSLHATPPLDPGEPVLVAGDPEERPRGAHADGIPLTRRRLRGPSRRGAPPACRSCSTAGPDRERDCTGAWS